MIYCVKGSIFDLSYDAGFHWHYNIGDPIYVSSYHVRSFYNQLESYPYNNLPWPCKHELYNINFRQSSNKRNSICGIKQLSSKEINKFIDAIDESYQYQLLLDNLPVTGLIGFKQNINFQNTSHGITTKNDNLYFLITHRHFHIKYNKNEIITVNISTRLQSDHYIEIKRDYDLNKIQMTYSVSWSSTDISYKNRIDAQMNFNLNKYELEAHWLWILNSSLLVILLTGLLSMILLRTLKNDVATYFKIDDDVTFDDNDVYGEFGWKRLKFDVFRAPNYKYLFAAIIGNGIQLLLITFLLLILGVIGYFYPYYSTTKPFAIIGFLLYLPTSYISGFISSKKLKELLSSDETKHFWLKNCLLSSSLFIIPFLFILLINTIICNYYHSDSGISFHSIVLLTLFFIIFIIPLNGFGSYRGKKCKINQYPCNTKHIQRPLPSSQPWYLNRILSVLISGFLPFLSIYVELHTIFISIFGNKPYRLFGILLITFIILLIVTSFISILMTYFQLNHENYNWWWITLIRGTSCGIFIIIYSIYYYHNSYFYHKHNILIVSIYFGFTTIIAFAISLILSTVSHLSSRWFIIKIYDAIKAH